MDIIDTQNEPPDPDSDETEPKSDLVDSIIAETQDTLGQPDRNWLESLLATCEFVRWDWFQSIDSPSAPQTKVSIFGWIEYDDAPRDIVNLVVDVQRRSFRCTTSSREHAKKLQERLAEQSSELVPGTAVNSSFSIDNAVEHDSESPFSD